MHKVTAVGVSVFLQDNCRSGCCSLLHSVKAWDAEECLGYPCLPALVCVQVKLGREQKGDSFSSSKDMGEPMAGRVTTTPSKDMPTALDYEGAAALLPASTRANSAALQGSGGAVPQLPNKAGAQSFGGIQDSGGAASGDVSALSTGLASQRFGTGATQSSRTAGGLDERLSSVSALLKARSDVVVLRDLKIGPLLGRGSYGRVYKGVYA